jgi:hypothetical protein
MAQFDIKNAMMYIRDGYTASGKVNLMAGYAIGLATMAVDTFDESLVVGDRFTIAGDTTEYTITAKSDTLGVTTSITFTPALVAMAADNAVITVLPHQLQIKLGEGNLTYTEKKARQYIKDRGRLSTVRNADEEPVEVKMDAQWEFIRASTGLPPSIEDVLKQRGEASTWVTSATDPCEPYAVDVIIEYTPPCGNVEMEIITLSDFRYEDLPHDTKAGTISISGKCNITEASVARVAA